MSQQANSQQLKRTLVIKYIEASGQDFFFCMQKKFQIFEKLKKQKILEICINRNHTNRGLSVHESTTFKFKPPNSSGNFKHQTKYRWN